MAIAKRNFKDITQKKKNIQIEKCLFIHAYEHDTPSTFSTIFF